MFNDFEVKLTPESNWEFKYVHIYEGIYISPSENDYKRGIKQKLLDENEYAIEEVKSKEGYNYFVLAIKSKTYHILIRSTSRISLEYIIFHATQQSKKDVGRPLTFYPHLSNIESPLEENRLKENNYKGFLNLMILALFLSHVRLMYENWVKYGLLISPYNIIAFLSDVPNLVFLTFTAALILFAILMTFLIEKTASRFKKYAVFYLLHGLNLTFLLLAPLYFHKLNIITPMSGILAFGLITPLFLKLFSYIHFWHDVRIFIVNKSRLIKNDVTSKSLQGSIYKEIEEVIENYPRNLRLGNLLKFLVMPVLCYQYKYPQTQRIRKRAVLNYAIQSIACTALLFFISGQYMYPTIMNAMKFFKNDDYMNIIERILKLAIPNVYGWIIMFYALFHCWLNLLAELTRFGDRNFYKDWWNSLYLDEYWRNWNLPTHYWLMRHVYNPLRRKKVDKVTASAMVFFISAVFHEYIISSALGYVNYWAFFAMFANWPISILQGYLKQMKIVNERSNIMNVLFWITFCFLGQPLCMLMYFYNYFKTNEINQIN